MTRKQKTKVRYHLRAVKRQLKKVLALVPGIAKKVQDHRQTRSLASEKVWHELFLELVGAWRGIPDTVFETLEYRYKVGERTIGLKEDIETALDGGL